MRPVPSCRTALSGLAACFSLVAAPAQAQIGGLIKKATQKAPAPQAALTPDTYTDILIELKEDQLGKVIAGKKAGNAFAASAKGPAAIRARHQAAVKRLEDHRQKNAAQIEAWEERLRLQRNCADSAWVVLDELRSNELSQRMMNDPVLKQKMIQLSPRIAAAQQKAAQGDSAELIKVTAELQALGKPTAADTAEVKAKCPMPPALPSHSQLIALQEEVDKLAQELAQADAEVARLEEQASGLNRKQLAVACERILVYLQRVKEKKAQQGFSQEELDALNKSIGDLQKLCG